jgi:hypothetical protein
MYQKVSYIQASVSRLDGDDRVKVSKLFVDHKTKNSHLSGTAVVELDGTLLELCLFVVVADPANRESRAREVSWKGSLGLLPSDKLQGTNKDEDLSKASSRHGTQGSKAGWNVREGCSIVGDISWQTDPCVVSEEANDSKHADTSMLELNKSKTVELLLVSIGKKSERIEESKRRLCTKLALEAHLHCR